MYFFPFLSAAGVVPGKKSNRRPERPIYQPSMNRSRGTPERESPTTGEPKHRKAAESGGQAAVAQMTDGVKDVSLDGGKDLHM